MPIVMVEKTYRAIRHEVVRKRQREDSADTRHPDEKINQIRLALNDSEDLNILELFAGSGNLTKEYAKYGSVVAVDNVGKVYAQLVENMKDYDNVVCERKNSFYYFHELISKKKKFNVVDLDPYGFPNRVFPDVYQLIEDGYLFVTVPKPYVNILNGITQAHLISYYGNHNPSQEEVIERIALWGICHWRKSTLIDSQDLKSVWRFCFLVEKVKATEYTGVRNR